MTDGPARPLAFILLAALLSGTLAWAASLRTSATFDEIVLVAGGVRGLAEGRWEMITDQPPLPMYLYGAAALDAARQRPPEDRSWEFRDRWTYARLLFFGLGNDHRRMLARARAILARDIATMQRVIWSGEKAIKYVFRGRPEALTFVAIAPPYPSTPGPYFITYAVAPAISADGRAAGKAALVRSRTRYHPEIKSFAALDAAAGADPEGGSVVRPRTDNVPIIEGPFAYRFSYGAPDGTKWRWQSPWPFDDKLPALIRLEIKDARSGRPVAAPIILRPRIELERACLSTKKRIRGCSQRRGGQAQPGAGKAAKEKLNKATSDAKAPG